MAETEETVLVGWARDADGGAQRFTGEHIYERVGVWCMDPFVDVLAGKGRCLVHGPHTDHFHLLLHGARAVFHIRAGNGADGECPDAAHEEAG